MTIKKITKGLTRKMADLSRLKIDKKEEEYFTEQFNETLQIINKFNKLNTSKVSGTDHVTGSENVFRDDYVEKDRMLSQKEALSNAKTTHNGYFVVKAIFDE